MPFLAPVFGAVAAFAGTWFGQIVIGIGGSIVAGLLQTWLNGDKQPEKQKQSGFKLSVQMGDVVPLSFPVGYAGTAGTRKYIGTWGQSGEVPNAYLTEVVQVADMPVPGLSGFWAMKQKCTIDWGATPTEQGYPVVEFPGSMWVKFRTGVETTADPFLVDKFGGHPQYPWTPDMIGRGAPHAIVTVLFNRELFTNGKPDFLFEPTPRVFYDLRKDSTNGGSGLHRWNDQSTWETTVNPVVIMYNIIRGIYYDGEWIFGGRNLPAFRLPPSSWMAAANECDVPIALAGGGTEPQFRCGYEISVSDEPLTVIEELGRSCNARLSEIGGIWEILVGSPGAAVYSFTDDDIIVTRGQTYTSFPGLADTHNAIEATYPEPRELWAFKDAPARYNTTWEAEDGGRRLATGLSFAAVPYGLQVQRLMNTLISDDRRWRTHFICLPPSAWILTGTCVVSWTSERNGYVNKKFLVTRIEGEPGMMQPVLLREIDPSDYSWSSDQQLPNPIGELVIIRPSPQLVTGFQALPATIFDSDGTPRRPTIRVTYDGNMPDIRAVAVLVRLKSSGAVIFEGEIPFIPPYSNLLSGVFLPDTLYEVAIKYVPYTGRPTEWTAWQDVLTPDVMLVPGKDFVFDGVIGFDGLLPDVRGWQDWAGSNIRKIWEEVQALANAGVNGGATTTSKFSEMRREFSVVVGDLTASFEEVIELAVFPLNGRMTALASAITSLSAGDGTDVNTARMRMGVQDGPTGYSRIAFEARSDNADPNAFRLVGLYMDTPNNPAQPSRVAIAAQQFVVVIDEDDVGQQIMVVDSGGLRVGNALIRTASIGDLEVTSAKMALLSVGSAQIDNLAVTRAKIALLSVGDGQIDNLAVTTLKIAGNAVTVPAIAATNADLTIVPPILSVGDFNVDAYMNTIQTVGITTTALGDIYVDCSFSTRPSSSGDYCFLTGRLLRNGVEIRRWSFISSGLGNPYSSYAGAPAINAPQAIPVADFGLPAGTYTYTLQVAAGRWISGDNIIVSNRQIRALNRLK